MNTIGLKNVLIAAAVSVGLSAEAAEQCRVKATKEPDFEAKLKMALRNK